MIHRAALVASIAGLLATSGCATDPATGERRPTNAGIGALGGAAGGAILGGLIGNNGTGALIGGAVGALTGGAVGSYMDRQERDLRSRTSGTGIGVYRRGDEIRLDIPAGITFDFNSAALQPGFRASLDRVAQTLASYQSTYVDIGGHTDAIGSDAVNQRLSEARAATVADYLERQGVAPQRVGTRGFGKTQPIASNDTEEGRARNRRVEINLVPITDQNAGRRPGY
ncbi:MAG: OmpA family protein [Janthinobacterium lividum]